MPNILIAGSASGLGQAFLNAYGNNSSNTIITCDKQAQDVGTSQKQSAKITHHILDITSSSSISSFVESIKDQPIDLVIYSIGVRGLVNHLHTDKPGSALEAETLDAMDVETMTSTFHINTVGTFMLLRSILPNLRLAREKSRKNPKVVVMSSRMGSVSANVTGASYAYRASKAALNAVMKSFSIDVPEIVWVLCHPGRVESKLVKYKEEGAVSAEESVMGLLPIIESWSREDSGRFYDRFGKKIEW